MKDGSGPIASQPLGLTTRPDWRFLPPNVSGGELPAETESARANRKMTAPQQGSAACMVLVS